MSNETFHVCVHTKCILDEMSIFNSFFSTKIKLHFDFYCLLQRRMLLKKYNYCIELDTLRTVIRDSQSRKQDFFKLESNRNKWTSKDGHEKNTFNSKIQSKRLTFRFALGSKMLISSKLNWNYYSYFRGVMVVHFIKDIESFACKNKLLSCNHDCTFFVLFK